jgi:hypothetical protein
MFACGYNATSRAKLSELLKDPAKVESLGPRCICMRHDDHDRSTARDGARDLIDALRSVDLKSRSFDTYMRPSWLMSLVDAGYWTMNCVALTGASSPEPQLALTRFSPSEWS